MSATPESTLADPQQIIADLQRQVAECRAERDEALAECDKAQRRLVERTAERDEALEQQTATAEVLQVINSSPGDLAPVFDAVLDKATRCCDAAFGTLWTYDGDSFNAIALQQVPEAYAEFLSQAPLRPVPFSGLGRVAAGESVAHFVDVAANEAYGGGDPALRALLELGKARSTVAVPLRKDNTVLGAITAYRQEVRPFSDKQIALLENFAAQAVIAMENARLITETREALEQQTATAEVLGVINSSPGDLKPVFDALLEKATRLCEGSQGVLWTLENDSMRCAAMFGATPEYAAFLLRGASPGPATPMGRILRGERVIEIRDLAEDEGYRAGDPVPRAAVEMGGLRSMIFVALVREETLLGGFAIARPEVRPFTDKQIALLQNFAAQAVIAMENARLITETREALEQQTATAEVLQVINSSPGDLTPVFDAILEKAHSLCGAAFGGLLIYDGDRFKAVALHNVPPAFAEIARQGFSATPPNPIARLLEGEPLVQIADLKEIAEVAPTGSLPRAGVDLAGIRTLLLVPLRKGDALLGVITAYRQEVCRFSDKQIALLQNFAAQAVIAIENARLITETREALEQQTATAEVLQVINSSPGALGPVFDAMLEKAMHLCSADFGVMNTYDGKHFHHAADQGVPLAYARYRRERGPTTYGPGTTPVRLVAGENLIHTADLMATEAYERAEPARRALVDLGGAHTHLTAALRKGDVLLGDISIYRQEVRPFADKQIALLENFAAQAVIAMENARLLTETREALEQQTATGEVLQVINSSPGDLEPVFDAILEKALHLCGAAHGHVFRVEGDLGRAVAACGDPEFVEWLLQQGPVRPTSGGILSRMMQGERVVQIPDSTDTEGYRADTAIRELIDRSGVRTTLGVALRNDSALLGAIFVNRREVRPFSEKEIALLENFGAQAVIAMENARLLAETREALDQQTATAEVLKVINASPGDLDPVFQAMLQKAHTLCQASFGALMTYDGERFHPVAHQGTPAPFREFLAPGIQPGPTDPFGLMVEGAALSHIHDLSEVVEQYPGEALPRAAVDLGRIRTLLVVPLRKDSALLGAITAYRQEVRPFTGKQIALLQNFAAQAVIAMDNARLITETREALDQQTAVSDVLQVISRSTFDLHTVLGTLAETAMRLCEAEMAYMLRREGNVYRTLAAVGSSSELNTVAVRYGAFLETHPIVPNRGTLAGRVALEGRPVQILDVAADPEYTLNEAITLGEIHTQLGVPLMREGAPVGVIILSRQRVEAFSDRQTQLVTTFADQAIIAMENARLIGELREARDAAEKALTELKTAQASLIHVEKMASLGQLTAGIAHEIKNPLNFVNNFAGLSVDLLDELKETVGPAMAALDENKRADIDEIVGMVTGNLEKIAEHGRRADGIVKSMLDHSRGGTGERRPVDLNNLVEEALNLAYHGARAQDQNFNITLERDFAAAIAPIELVPQDVTRVLLNLIGNGFYAAIKRLKDSAEAGFRPALKVATRDLGEAVEIRVRDNGAGILPEIRDKLFQPFFTTKPTGEGTGLGLSISWNIVTQGHGGTIEVDSRVGEFTEFTVRLPRARHAATTSAAE